MTTQNKISREQEIAAILKKIYESYGADLAKFFERVAQTRNAPKPMDLQHVGRAVRKYERGDAAH